MSFSEDRPHNATTVLPRQEAGVVCVQLVEKLSCRALFFVAPLAKPLFGSVVRPLKSPITACDPGPSGTNRCGDRRGDSDVGQPLVAGLQKKIRFGS